MSKQYLGAFEEIVLLSISSLGDEAYGVTIANIIEKKSGKRASTGALYTTLSRLEEKGLISSWMGKPTEERGGRAKKFYVIEDAGKQMLVESLEVKKSFMSGLNFSLR